MTYPDSPTYTVADFDAVAAAYAAGATIVDAAGPMSEPTARRFLRRNGLLRDDGPAVGRHVQRVRAEATMRRVAALTRQSYSARAIATRLDLHPRSVMRHRARARALDLL